MDAAMLMNKYSLVRGAARRARQLQNGQHLGAGPASLHHATHM